MKKIFLFFICLIVSISGVKALDLDLYSTNAIIYNYSNDAIIYEDGDDEKVAIGSMTKIMTALVLIENIDDINKEVVLQDKHFEGLKEAGASLAGFFVGETVTYRDLLYGILLPSGADAVQALSIEVFGSNEKTVEVMNERATSLGLTNTHFTNPFGLDNGDPYSTVREVSIILKEALNNTLFKDIFTTRRYLTSDRLFTLYSTLVTSMNEVNLKADYIKGTKTGYTLKAGRCLSSLAYDEKNDIYYLMVTAGAVENGKFYHILDAINTYEYLFDNYSNNLIVKKDEVVTSIKTKYAKEKKIDVIATDNINIFMENSSYDKNKVSYVYKMDNKITRISKVGTKVGELTVSYDGGEIKTVDLLLASDMHFSLGRFIYTTLMPLLLVFIACIFIFKRLKTNTKR